MQASNRDPSPSCRQKHLFWELLASALEQRRLVICSREGRGPWRRERFSVADAGAFHDCIGQIGGYVFQGFDSVDFCGFTEAEVEAEIVLGEIASATADFGDLADSGSVDGYASANGGAIALRADQFEQNAVITIVVLVEQQTWRLSDVDQHHVDVASVKNVPERCPAPRF